MSFAFSLHPAWILSLVSFGLLIVWALWAWSRKTEEAPGALIRRITITLLLGAVAILLGVSFHPLVGIPLAALVALIMGGLWGRNIGTAFAAPLANLYDGGNEAPEPRPFYAIAEAHRKQARYPEAIRAIQEQLEKFPEDVEGLLLLAEIHARNLDDWDAARNHIRRIAENPNHPVSTRAKALQALSDWYLDFKADNPGAIECLQAIQTLFPDTPEAHEAAQRLAHVGDGSWRRERREASTLRVPKGDDRMGLRVSGKPADNAVPEAKDPEIEVRELLAQLEAHPLDTEARQRLALVYAEGLERPEWAVCEIERLIAQPSQSSRQIARWLHLLADVHIRCSHDEEAARAALTRILQAYPDSAVAANAQSRLDVLKLEVRGQRKP